MAKWVKGTVTLNQRRNGTAQRDGWISPCGRIGITKGYGIKPRPGSPYLLTHIPTGFAFGLHFRNLKEAQLAASKFLSLPVNWATTNPADVVTPAGKQLYRAMKDRPLHKSQHKGIPLGEDFANPYVEVEGFV